MPHIDVRTWSAETWKSEGRAAVAAVLETLADADCTWDDARLERLAAEVKED